jgi:type 1 fimbria pilin
MKTPKLAAILAILSLALSNSLTAGAATGVIRFSGRVVAPTSAFLVFYTSKSTDESVIRQTYALRDAQHSLATNVLDYFATYAPADAQLISVTYN